jgi:hypothetical protein
VRYLNIHIHTYAEMSKTETMYLPSFSAITFCYHISMKMKFMKIPHISPTYLITSHVYFPPFHFLALIFGHTDIFFLLSFNKIYYVRTRICFYERIKSDIIFFKLLVDVTAIMKMFVSLDHITDLIYTCP